jgi:hypothetical protein
VESFLLVLGDMIQRLKDGDVVGLNAHYEPNGIGRVSGSTADGQDVPDTDLPAFDTSDITGDTAPGKGQKR